MKRWSNAEFIQRAQAAHANRYDYSEVHYVNQVVKVRIGCPVHGFFEQHPGNHVRGVGCPQCAGNQPGTTTDFINAAKKLHGDHYDYSQTEYKTSHSALTIICRRHGPFQQAPSSHLAGHRCPECSIESIRAKNAKSSEKFVEDARRVHGNLYDYSETTYTSQAFKVRIKCAKHGIFEQFPNNHLRGAGCFKCGIERTSAAKTYSTQDFISKAQVKHGARYGYSKTAYTSSSDKVVITCPEHGDFEQEAASHLTGIGCPTCGDIQCGLARRITQAEFSDAVFKMYGNAYDISETVYSTGTETVKVRCKKHGVFERVAVKFLNGHGCPKCYANSSKPEQELYRWIASIASDALQHERIDGYEIDVLVPSARVGVEFNGTYWHSYEPGSMKSLDVQKMAACKAQGYQLLIVWEHDWKSKRAVIQHWLQHKLGKAPRLCSARQTEVSSPTHREAARFYEQFHLQGAPASNGVHFGLKFKDQWVAMVTFSHNVERNVKLAEGEYYFSRLAFAGSVPGAASKLFKAAVKATEAKAVYAHSDNSYADGDVKARLGFEVAGQLEPRYRIWHPLYGVRHRTFWQKARIPDRLREMGLDVSFDPNMMTTFDGHRLCGARHVWDCGKTRWKWTALPKPII